MANYTNPGVTVNVTNTPVITSATGNPINICLVGQAPATQSATSDNYSLTSSTSVAIVSNPGISATSPTNNIPYFFYTASGTTTAGISNLYSSGTYYSYGTDFQVGLTGTTSTTVGGQLVPPNTAFITSGTTTLTTTGTPASASITAVSASATTWTITATNTFVAGQTVIISGITGATGYNGTYVIATASSSSFTIANTSSPSGTPGYSGATATNTTVTLALYANGNILTTTATGTTQATATFAWNATASAISTAITTAINASFLNGNTVQLGSTGGTGTPTYLGLALTVPNPLGVSGTPATINFAPLSNTATTFNTVTFSTTTSGYSTGTSLTATNTMASQGGTYPVWISLNYNYSPLYGNVLNYFNSFTAVAQYYGNSFTSSGTINSPLSLAAYLAFQNGAGGIYTIAVGNGASATDKSVSTSITLSQMEYIFTNILAGNNSIDTIVPLYDYSTSPGIIQFFNNYLSSQASIGTLQRLFVSRDQSNGGTYNQQTPASTLQTDAQTFSNQRVSVVYPTVIQLQTSSVTPNVNVGGYYAAAGMAGLFNSLPGPQNPLTHQILQGFYTIPNPYKANDLLSAQGSGVVCFSQRTNGDIYCRHALTTNMSNYLTQEISIIAAEDALFKAIRKSLVDANIIGTAFSSNTPNIITSLIQSTLSSAVNNNLIQAFSGIQYQIAPNNPTQVNVTFQYAPTFPLNYINVTFNIDPTAGATSFSSTTNAFNMVGV